LFFSERLPLTAFEWQMSYCLVSNGLKGCLTEEL